MNHTVAAMRGFSCPDCGIGVIGTYMDYRCRTCADAAMREFMSGASTAFQNVHRKPRLCSPPKTLEQRMREAVELCLRPLRDP